MWVCFFPHRAAKCSESSLICYTSPNRFISSRSYISTEAGRKKKNRCASFQLLQRWSGARTFSEMLLLEVQLHHADNMEIIISGWIYNPDARRSRMVLRKRVTEETNEAAVREGSPPERHYVAGTQVFCPLAAGFWSRPTAIWSFQIPTLHIETTGEGR